MARNQSSIDNLLSKIDYSRLQITKECEQELRRLLHDVDKVIKARNKRLLRQLSKAYKQSEYENKLYRRQKLTVKKNTELIESLQGQVHRITAEKKKYAEMYEVDVIALNSEIIIVEDQIRAIEKEKHENEQANEREVIDLKSTIIELQCQVDQINKEKQQSNEMSQQQDLDRKLEIKALKSQILQVTIQKESLKELHEKQMTAFREKVETLKCMYGRLYSNFQIKMSELKAEERNPEYRSREIIQQIKRLSQKLKDCENMLIEAQRETTSFREQVELLDLEYRRLQEKEERLMSSNTTISQVLQKTEAEKIEGETELNELQISDKNQMEKLSKYKKYIYNLQVRTASLKDTLKIKLKAVEDMKKDVKRYEAGENIGKVQLLNRLMEDQKRLVDDLSKKEMVNPEYFKFMEKIKELQVINAGLEKKLAEQDQAKVLKEQEMQNKIKELEEHLKKQLMDKVGPFNDAIKKLEAEIKNERANRLECEQQYDETIKNLDVLTINLRKQLREAFESQT